MAQQQPSKRKPTQLSDFQGLVQIVYLAQQKGHGAFGKVYRGMHKQTKKVFALKKISKREVKAQNMITQLNNQIKISKQLNHPHIVKLYDTFDDGEDIYLVLELAPNGQLFSKICREQKLDERTAKRIIKEVLEAVSYLHSRNPPIIHRDIKPQNILLDKNNQVKLADFGWSNFLNKPRKTYCGTFDYLAPQMIDKSGHDEKLDIWCLGVLTFELLTGKTPFVVSGGTKNEVKKLIQQNILEVNINFPNDFPILAKSFILGMVKRKPEQRLTLQEIMSHEWLTSPDKVEKPFQPFIPMTKKPQRQAPLIDAQQDNIVAAQNTRIKQLQQEVNRLRVNEKAMATQAKGINDNPDYITLMGQLRKMRNIEQNNIKLKGDNQRYWQELSKKDKQIIQLKGHIKMLEDNQQSIDKLKADKKSLNQKVRKLQKDLQNSQIKNAQLTDQLAGISDSLSGRLARGEKIKLSQAQSQQFIQLLQNEIKILQEKFQQNKGILLKVLNRQKMSKQREQQLIKLRVEKKKLQDQIRSELKEQFAQQKDNIILQARKQLSEQRQKWMKERAQLQKIYEQQSSGPTKTYSFKQDLDLQLKTVRQLQSFNEVTINELKIRVKELEQELKRKK